MIVNDKRIAFLSGNMRSGTTALVSLMNTHPRVMVFAEKYANIAQRGKLSSYDFEPEQFLDLSHGQQGRAISSEVEYFGDLQARYANATIVGDKFPSFHRVAEPLKQNFSDAPLVYIVRNPLSVAESYQARFETEKNWHSDFGKATKDWNASVNLAVQWCDAGAPITVVCYERLMRSPEAVARLHAAVGLDPAEADADRIKGFTQRGAEKAVKLQPRNEDVRYSVARNARFDLYRRLVNEFCILPDM